MLIGSNQQFSLIIGIHAPSFTPASTVWINPIGITNAANYTPITNAYAPGELVSLNGNFGVSTEVAQGLPIPTTTRRCAGFRQRAGGSGLRGEQEPDQRFDSLRDFG